MSLKKDNFNLIDKKFMQFAIKLANNQKALTGINPSVGCVIVKNKKIISYGVTSINGRPHAETIALRKNKKENCGSTMYLTLEPCSHYGKTPPCTNAIIKSKIRKVYYSSEDFDYRSYKKSKKLLKSKKIIVNNGLLINEIKDLYLITTSAFNNPLYTLFYILSMIALALHLKHGVGSAVQTIGLKLPNYEKPLKYIAESVALIIPATFASIPIYLYIKNL